MGADAGRTWALKEWAATGRLLAEGRSCVLLRKGGIHEKDFGVPAREFLLWPTYLHQHASGLRPEFRDAALAAMAESHDDARVAVRVACRVADIIRVEDERAAAALAAFHPYTDEQVAMRLAFRPRKVLTALVVEPLRLVEHLSVPFQEAWAGCRSWVELPVGWPGVVAALPAGATKAVAERMRTAVGGVPAR